MTKVYVAGRDVERVRRYMAALGAAGHEVTFDWTQDPKISPAAVPVRAALLAERCLASVSSADRVLLLGDDLGADGGAPLGALIEAALGASPNAPTLVLRPRRQSIFWYSPLFYVCNSFDEVLAELSEEAA